MRYRELVIARPEAHPDSDTRNQRRKDGCDPWTGEDLEERRRREERFPPRGDLAPSCEGCPELATTEWNETPVCSPCLGRLEILDFAVPGGLRASTPTHRRTP